METNFSERPQQFDDYSNNSKKREVLFAFQNIVVVGVLVLMTWAFFFYNHPYLGKGIKIIFAPLLSVVPLLFVLSILKDLKKGFRGDDYTKKEIINFSGLAIAVCAGFVGIAALLSKINTLEILLACAMAILCLAFFLKLKVKNVLGMAITTGIAQGIIVYIVFLF